MGRPGIEPAAAIDAIRKRLADLDAMVDAVHSEYVFTGDMQHFARFQDVLANVSRRLGVPNNPTFRRDLKACLLRMGWRYANWHNRKLWRGARALDQSDESARQAWLELRGEFKRSSGRKPKRYATAD